MSEFFDDTTYHHKSPFAEDPFAVPDGGVPPVLGDDERTAAIEEDDVEEVDTTHDIQTRVGQAALTDLDQRLRDIHERRLGR